MSDVANVLFQLSPETTPGSASLIAMEEPALIIENEVLKENSHNDFTAIAKLGECRGGLQLSINLS